MLCHIIGNYSIYCGDEYIGHMHIMNDNTFSVESAKPEQYDLEKIFNYEKLIENIYQAREKGMFSVLNYYGLFRFVEREHYNNAYDYLYENIGYT